MAATTLSPADRIYTDGLTKNGLEFFWEYPASMNVIEYSQMDAGSGPSCDSYVLFNRSYNDWLTVNYGTWMTLEPFRVPDAIAAGLDAWPSAWTNGNATLYRVSCE